MATPNADFQAKRCSGAPGNPLSRVLGVPTHSPGGRMHCFEGFANGVKRREGERLVPHRGCRRAGVRGWSDTDRTRYIELNQSHVRRADLMPSSLPGSLLPPASPALPPPPLPAFPASCSIAQPGKLSQSGGGAVHPPRSASMVSRAYTRRTPPACGALTHTTRGYVTLSSPYR